ncbi:unnamed protein product [Rotaria sp. Silwood2]|nr:unnamed protein product [Rotaria sp. Silwood2]CAF4106607.1 unnamed protein product [Rotaria sp. Silwood2]
MLSSTQLLSVLSITLVVLSVHFVNGVPINSDSSDEINSVINDATKLVDDEPMFYKRKLPLEGILIGRRDFPNDGSLLDKRDYPTEGILLGKRQYPFEGILLGKRNYPTEGILLGKRDFRLFAPKPTFYN